MKRIPKNPVLPRRYPGNLSRQQLLEDGRDLRAIRRIKRKTWRSVPVAAIVLMILCGMLLFKHMSKIAKLQIENRKQAQKIVRLEIANKDLSTAVLQKLQSLPTDWGNIHTEAVGR
jgi:hypothetical protein